MSGSPVIFDLRGKRVFVAGHAGMVGSAIVRRLEREDCDIIYAARRDLDLRNSDEVDRFMAQAKPDAVFVAAGKVGGIRANSTFPADFIADNIAIALNTIRAAHRYEVKKLLYLGSSCIYPRLAPQPMTPDMLLSGPLEPTNQWYAVAKIAGIKLCEAYRLQYGADFVSVMPTNLYGPGDNYHPREQPCSGGADAALSRGQNRRRRACRRLGHRRAAARIPRRRRSRRRLRLRHEDAIRDLEFLNVGTGEDTTIAEFARLVADVVGYAGQFDVRYLAAGRHAAQAIGCVAHQCARLARQDTVARGLQRMYADFLARYDAIRARYRQITLPSMPYAGSIP